MIETRKNPLRGSLSAPARRDSISFGEKGNSLRINNPEFPVLFSLSSISIFWYFLSNSEYFPPVSTDLRTTSYATCAANTIPNQFKKLPRYNPNDIPDCSSNVSLGNPGINACATKLPSIVRNNNNKNMFPKINNYILSIK